MATSDKNKSEQTLSVESRLKSLYELQTILSQIDRIRTVRGELPLEVKDLEDSIEGLTTRISNFQQEIEDLRKKTIAEKEKINESQSKIATYKVQLDNVRNNREFDLLSKEIEFQTLEIELSEKHINEYQRSSRIKPQRSPRQKRLFLTVSISSQRKKPSLTKSFQKPNRMKNDCVNRQKLSNRRLTPVL